MEWPAVTRLVIVGDGERAYVDSLKRFATEHAGTLPRIDWIGAVWGDARWKYFQGADLFCLEAGSSLSLRQGVWVDIEIPLQEPASGIQ
jgi:hypothetical protein